MSMLYKFVTGISLWLLVVCCQANDLPDFGDSSGSIISPAQERLIGEMVYRQSRHQSNVVDDPELVDYLITLGSKVTDHSDGFDGDWTFFLIHDTNINAFAAPGGFIGVHTGLILNARNESEVAAVLAHEVAHVTQRHLARSFEHASQFSLPMMAAMIGAIVVATQNPEAGMAGLAAVQAGAMQDRINFTRANEQEADAIGMTLLYKAGFNPYSMPEFFKQLQSVNRFSSGAHVPEFLRTHPVTVNRIAESLSRADQLAEKDYLLTTPMFYLAKARIRAHVLNEKPGQAARYFEEQLRSQGNDNALADRYGYVEALILAGEFDKAQIQSTLLQQAAPEQAAFLLQAGRLAMEATNLHQALEIYEQASERFPKSRAATLGYIEALLLNGVNKKAHGLLRDYTYSFRPDYKYHKLMAESYSRQGSQIESHMELAEQYHSLGGLKLAVAQLKLAAAVPNGSFYQQERIKSRQLEIEKQLEAIKEMDL